MSYLKFDKTLMANLDESLQREYIRTNRKGAYSSSTIVGCNTRKYHGLLVVPIPELGDQNRVLLSSLDLTIIQHGAEFNVAVHHYKGGVISPNGHKYIREYNVDIIPATIFRVGGVVLKREQVFCHYINRAIFKYTLMEAHSDTLLRFRPLLAFRSVAALTHENGQIERGHIPARNGIGISLYKGYPHLFMQFSKEPEYREEGYWYKDFEYPKEKERGYECTEDLYMPGTFEIPIKKGESIYFAAGLEEANPNTLRTTFVKEVRERIPREDFFSCLRNAAHQLYYRPTPDDGYLLAGYPWFDVRARDLFVALPGCTLCVEAPERFERIVNTVIPAMERYIRLHEDDETIHGLHEPDVGIWAIWAIQQYARRNGLGAAKRFGSFVSEVVSYYLSAQHPTAQIRENGLLYVLGTGFPLSWMDAKLNGKAVIPREGYLVELNALWYNALCFERELNGEKPEIGEIISRIERSFPDTFLNCYNYLFDYVRDGKARDWSVPPTTPLAIALPCSPLQRDWQLQVLEIITRELLTPKGLRSLSPKSEGYRPYCRGKQEERELAYYNGSVWPWLLGQYTEAYLRLYGNSGVTFLERMLIGMEEELQMHGIGTISELFDGNPPFMGRGAISFAMSVGEILRAKELLNRTESDMHLSVRHMYNYTKWKG